MRKLLTVIVPTVEDAFTLHCRRDRQQHGERIEYGESWHIDNNANALVLE
ncbi:MAG TPA: hypothetical protein VGJ20_46765 [Xanthobacteraceae bacterium]|jgi:hypothetical protein